MTVYADILFLVDASMDLVVLWLCARLFHRGITTGRLLVSAAVGGLGSVGLLFLPERGWLILCTGLLLSAGMTLVSFGYGTARRFVTMWIAVWGCGALLGGVMTMLMRLGKPVYTAAGGGSYPLFYTATIGLCAVCLRLWRRKRTERTARLHIRHGDWQTEVTALVDSGNLVTDPISGIPVIFLSADSAPDFPVTSDWLLGRDCPECFLRSMRVIPTRTIDGTGCVGGFVAEECTVNGMARRAVIVVERRGEYGDCGALCPASLCGTV